MFYFEKFNSIIVSMLSSNVLALRNYCLTKYFADKLIEVTAKGNSDNVNNIS